MRLIKNLNSFLNLYVIIVNLSMDGSSNTTSDLKKELSEYGFQEDHINIAMQMSTQKEEVLDLILKMIEDPTFYEETKATVRMKENKCAPEKIKTDNLFSEYNYKMVIAVRDYLKMGRGKIGAQVGHGVLGAYKMGLNLYPEKVKMWEEYSGSAKIVVKVNSEEELIKIRDQAKAKNLPYYLVRDAGRTQIASGTITVCAVGPGKVADIDTITGHLDLL